MVLIMIVREVMNSVPRTIRVPAMMVSIMTRMVLSTVKTLGAIITAVPAVVRHHKLPFANCWEVRDASMAIATRRS